MTGFSMKYNAELNGLNKLVWIELRLYIFQKFRKCLNYLVNICRGCIV